MAYDFEIRCLRALLKAGERGLCQEGLQRLREAYRMNPASFDPRDLSSLKEIGGLSAAGHGSNVPIPLPESGLQDGGQIPYGLEVPNPPPPRREASSLKKADSNPAFTERNQPKEIPDLPAQLKAVFGFDSFRPGQEDVIRAVLAGQDCLAVMPTGAGKSLTYQLPARLMGGTTLVVSPLIALMKDQVDALSEAGLRATCLNSSLDPQERAERVRSLRRGDYELVYAAPEGLEQSVGALLAHLDLRLIAVDEAHCISHWGHDFRPAYRNLMGLKERFEKVPVLAITATATEAVRKDILQQLGMRDAFIHQGSHFRPNLHLSAIKKGGETLQVREAILRLVRARSALSGIVYCLSRKNTEETAAFLREKGIQAAAYHAGLGAEERMAVQEAFRRDDLQVVCATIAFGMGIDKSNIRFVIHRDMPKSLEGYAQEIGRAGRDGAEADCVLFYSWADVMTLDRFTEDLEGDLAAIQKRQIREMYRFAEGLGCRHQRLLRHFEEPAAPCGNACDACSGRDVLEEASREIRRLRRIPKSSAEVLPEVDEPLFNQLKALRRHLADGRNVPAYVVFSDATLLEMAGRKPRTEEELLAVSGVGPQKLAQFGASFLEILKATLPSKGA